jgi:hypothetical protein
LRPTQPAGKATVSPWAWLAVTCVFLSISGGIRFGRDLQFSSRARESKTCPFPLNELPKVLGSWHELEGSESQLDPETARVAGSSDHIIRVYADPTTGETVSILVLYGLAHSVFAHTPDACYPASGYRAMIEPIDRELSRAGSEPPVRFRASYFVKQIAGVPRFDEVFCTFRHDGLWLPEVASRWKTFRYHPGMFKIQIQRHTSGIAIADSPTESLLREVVQAIESRLARDRAQNTPGAANAPAPGQS